jgi:plasmid stabilization system protein ParE
MNLDTIWTYIARDNPEVADRVIKAAYGVCRNLAEHPELGPLRRSNWGTRRGRLAGYACDRR